MPRECPRQFSEHRLGHTTALGLQRQSDASSIGTACGKKTWGWVCQLPATAVPNHHRVTSECLVDHSLDLHGHFERRQRLRTNDDEASLRSYRPNTPRRHVTMNGNWRPTYERGRPATNPTSEGPSAWPRCVRPESDGIQSAGTTTSKDED